MQTAFASRVSLFHMKAFARPQSLPRVMHMHLRQYAFTARVAAAHCPAVSRRNVHTFRCPAKAFALSVGALPLISPKASLFYTAKLNFHVSAVQREAANNTEKEQKSHEKPKEGETQAEGTEGEEPEKLNFFVKEYRGLKHDIKEFPDIYNAVNAFQFLIFSIFCLSSTGSQVEEQFWISICGVDWAWSALLSPLSHCLLTTNFLSMAFAMLLIHNLGHPVMNTVGSTFLLRFLALVVLMSGLGMLGLRKVLPEDSEVQYGPWDLIAGLFVVSALTNGYMPLQLLASFNGWVKYAAFFGSAVILFYDWQPCVLGAATAYGLHRFGIMRIPKVV